MRRDGFLCERIKFAGTRVALNGCVETIGIKRFEPSAESRQLARRQLFDGLFEVLGCFHFTSITPTGGSEKTASARGKKYPKPSR